MRLHILMIIIIMIIENLLNSAFFTLTPWRGLGNYALVSYSKRMKCSIIIIMIIIKITTIINRNEFMIS